MLPFLYKTYFGIFNYMKTLENNHNKNTKNPLHLLSSVQSNISSTSYKESWTRSTGSSVVLLLVKWGHDGRQPGVTATSATGGLRGAGSLEMDAVIWAQNLR